MIIAIQIIVFILSFRSSGLNFAAIARKQIIKPPNTPTRKGVKNALNYVIRNSESTFELNQDNELVSLEDIMNDW